VQKKRDQTKTSISVPLSICYTYYLIILDRSKNHHVGQTRAFTACPSVIEFEVTKKAHHCFGQRKVKSELSILNGKFIEMHLGV
jgi:hypothetical protein